MAGFKAKGPVRGTFWVEIDKRSQVVDFPSDCRQSSLFHRNGATHLESGRHPRSPVTRTCHTVATQNGGSSPCQGTPQTHKDKHAFLFLLAAEDNSPTMGGYFSTPPLQVVVTGRDESG